MAVEREGQRDWHRLFGLLLTDFFTGTPFKAAGGDALANMILGRPAKL